MRKRHSLPSIFSADLDQEILQGLTIAGVVVCCLRTIFALFHVELFLRAYQLPYATYSFGRVLFSVLSTGFTLVGARWLDSKVATTRLERIDLVGWLGILLAFSFILPFGRFWQPDADSLYWQAFDGLHFVVSLTLYDTLSTITTISLASAVSDDHNMTDQERIANQSSSQLYNLVASLIVATLGIKLFDPQGLANFQIYVVLLAALAIFVFGAAQSIISGKYRDYTSRNQKKRLWNIWKGWTVAIPKEIRMPTGMESSYSNNATDEAKRSKIVWRQVVKDLWNHSNFLRWLVLEMLLEMQTHFVLSFFKTFVDQLLVDVPHIISDWSLTLLQPMHQLMTIACYVPIKYYGYPRVYTVGFVILWLLSSVTLLVASPTGATSWTLVFLVVYAVGSEALRASAFYLVMSDLVLELKQSYTQQGRMNEPSLAGLLLGATTLVCKPMQSLLPILAATLLDAYPQQPREVLFYLLVLPPWICSMLQLWVWMKYDLHPHRTYELKEELQEIHFFQQQQQEQQLNASVSEHNELVPVQSSKKDTAPKQRGNYSTP